MIMGHDESILSEEDFLVDLKRKVNELPIYHHYVDEANKADYDVY